MPDGIKCWEQLFSPAKTLKIINLFRLSTIENVNRKYETSEFQDGKEVEKIIEIIYRTHAKQHLRR
jgi:hypothetical protein